MSDIKIYNLRIVPPNPVFEDAVYFKKQFIYAFGQQPLSKSKPHITLAKFKMHTENQSYLIKAFDQLSEIDKFNLEILEFDIFENNSNVLCLKVDTTKYIKRIHDLIKILWVREIHVKLAALEISQTPHLTISKANGNKMLHQSLEFFEKTNYSRQFEVNHLTLVSRYEGKTWDWEHQIKLNDSSFHQSFVYS